MRVIFDNGSESRALMRSFQRVASIRMRTRVGGSPSRPPVPLFSDQTTDGDEASGTIYVLRSKADHPLVAENTESFVHKIGVTNT